MESEPLRGIDGEDDVVADVQEVTIDDPLTDFGEKTTTRKSSPIASPTPSRCRSKLQKYCSVSFVMIYLLLYFSLSSNPKIIMKDYQYDDVEVAKTGAPPEHIALRNEHIQQMADQISRVWKPISPSQWCIDGRLKYEQAKGKPMGLCYLKIPRAASTTLAGINHRIASNFAKRQGIQSCIRHDGPTPAFYYRNRETEMSFLWTFVRDPTDRAISRVANGISKHPEEAHYTSSYSNNITDSYILKSLQDSQDVQYGAISRGRGGFQIQYTMLQVLDEGFFWNATQPAKIQKPAAARHFVKTLLRQYDFIGVVERMDESLVALQLLLGLETSDILYMSSRLPSQYTKSGGKCRKNIDSQTLRSQAVQDYLQSPTWWAQNYGDLMLHRGAIRSLEHTIHEIGYSRFRNAYQDFQDMKRQVLEQCTSTAIFPCSATGVDQQDASKSNCYEEDMGCGHPCMDHIAENITRPATPSSQQMVVANSTGNSTETTRLHPSIATDASEKEITPSYNMSNSSTGEGILHNDAKETREDGSLRNQTAI